MASVVFSNMRCSSSIFSGKNTSGYFRAVYKFESGESYFEFAVYLQVVQKKNQPFFLPYRNRYFLFILHNDKAAIRFVDFFYVVQINQERLVWPEKTLIIQQFFKFL